MSVSVIIPSRLAKAPDGDFWLEKAIRSVAAQTARISIREILLAVDNGQDLAALDKIVVPAAWAPIRGPAGNPGHVSAMNAAIAASSGDLLAFLEDDDLWHPKRLAYGLHLMDNRDFVSCSQLEVDLQAGPGPVNDFPTCSGWLMRRQLYLDCGPFDHRFRIHWDNEFLGRVNDKKAKRIHLVEKDADRRRPWLQNVVQFSRIMETHEAEPLVRRIVHADSIMGTAGRDKERAQRSAQEYAACQVLFNCIPW
jgi:glycosyltransferase involved in cell wall biosynthesis